MVDEPLSVSLRGGLYLAKNAPADRPTQALLMGFAATLTVVQPASVKARRAVAATKRWRMIVDILICGFPAEKLLS
jgi:hypothetical protein